MLITYTFVVLNEQEQEHDDVQLDVANETVANVTMNSTLEGAYSDDDDSFVETELNPHTNASDYKLLCSRCHPKHSPNCVSFHLPIVVLTRIIASSFLVRNTTLDPTTHSASTTLPTMLRYCYENQGPRPQKMLQLARKMIPNSKCSPKSRVR